jgi:hypothetical protein
LAAVDLLSAASLVLYHWGVLKPGSSPAEASASSRSMSCSSNEVLPLRHRGVTRIITSPAKTHPGRPGRGGGKFQHWPPLCYHLTLDLRRHKQIHDGHYEAALKLAKRLSIDFLKEGKQVQAAQALAAAAHVQCLLNSPSKAKSFAQEA